MHGWVFHLKIVGEVGAASIARIHRDEDPLTVCGCVLMHTCAACHACVHACVHESGHEYDRMHACVHACVHSCNRATRVCGCSMAFGMAFWNYHVPVDVHRATDQLDLCGALL